MSRVLYRLLLWSVFFLIPVYLLSRSRKQREYRQHWLERLGFYKPFFITQPVLWLHAVSVGETRAAKPLIEALQRCYPDHHIVLTQMTPTGRATAQSLFAHNLTVAYLPYDYPSAIKRFLDHFRPQLGVLLETEIWPNLIDQCAKRAIPLCLVNARLSEKSLNGYLRVKSLIAPAVRQLSAVVAQSSEDATRLQQLGAEHIQIAGNIKFDQIPNPEQIAQGQRWKQALQRPVLLFGSSRDGEEDMLLNYLAHHPLPDSTLLLLVPRHPQRFSQVAERVQQYGFSCLRRSEWQNTPTHVDVIVGDSMGEMVSYYRCADVALIGGSFAPLGGQNLIEAAAVGTPTIVGPHMFNFSEATTLAVQAGACQQVEHIDAAVALAVALLQEPQRLTDMQRAAQQFAQTHRGAVDKIMQQLDTVLQKKSRLTESA